MKHRQKGLMHVLQRPIEPTTYSVEKQGISTE